MGYSPWDCRESEMTKQLSLSLFILMKCPYFIFFIGLSSYSILFTLKLYHCVFLSIIPQALFFSIYCFIEGNKNKSKQVGPD